MPPVDPWEKLYRKVGQDRQERVDAQSRAKVAGQANDDYEKWCAEMASWAMLQIRDRAVERAAQFERQTGATITVTYPSQPPSGQVAQIAAEMLYLKLSLDRAVLHLYAARAVSDLPTFHTLSAVERLRPAAAPKRARDSVRPQSKERVESRPMGRLVRTGERECALRGPPSNGRAAPIDLDTIVYKSFEVLVGHWRLLK
jgi:hypothetical protein